MAGGASFVKPLLLLLLAFMSAHVGVCRKLLMFPRPGHGFGAVPGYGYGYGYGLKPGHGRPYYGAPPARQAPPASSGFPGPAIAMDPTQLETETVAAALADHKPSSVGVSAHSDSVPPGKLAQQQRQLME